jgi:hypothetical protein
MRFTWYVVFAALFLSFIPSAATFGSSSNSVTANVMVVCPFYLSENALPVYSIGGSTNMNYTIYTQAVCTLNNLQGSFSLEYSGNSIQVLSNTLPVTTATETPTLYSLPTVNTLTLYAGSYKAIVDFAAYGISNESTRTFLLVNPTNIMITSFAVSANTFNVGDPLTFTANIMNDGELASGQIGMNIIVTGPQGITISEPASALSPGQSEGLTFMFSNLTAAPGTYTVGLSATFASSNMVVQSSIASVSYYVTPPPATSHPSTPPPPSAVITIIPRLAFTQLPFYASLQLGGISVTSLGLQNVAAVPITAILSIPSEFSGIFGLSAYNVYLVPGESLSVQLVFNANNLKLPGTYVVPVGINVSSQSGGFLNRTQYFTYVVSKTSYNASVYSQVQIAQSNATVTTTLVGARNTSLTNATLVTLLPIAVVSNSSQINTYGLPATITKNNGELQINWLVPYLPPGKGITLSYTIQNPADVGLLENVQTLLIVPSAPTSSSLLKVVSMQTPTFYTNSINQISVGVLYTGTMPHGVKFMLTTPGTATVLNSVQLVNATPKQLLQQTFDVRTNNMTGTLILELQIEAQNLSMNYTLPVLVLQKGGPASTTSTVPQVASYVAKTIRYGIPVLGVAAACAIAYMLHRNGRRPKYQDERAKELIRIREQIKRSDEHA